MFKSIKKRLKDQRGLTLVELLAVIVILGIIAGIAVPNIGGIIDKTKDKAHIANAQQMISAARIMVASDNSETGPISLGELIDNGFLNDNLKNPEDKVNNYSLTDSKVTITKTNNKVSYTVILIQGGTTGETYVTGDPF